MKLNCSFILGVLLMALTSISEAYGYIPLTMEYVGGVTILTGGMSFQVIARTKNGVANGAGANVCNATFAGATGIQESYAQASLPTVSPAYVDHFFIVNLNTSAGTFRVQCQDASVTAPVSSLVYPLGLSIPGSGGSGTPGTGTSISWPFDRNGTSQGSYGSSVSATFICLPSYTPCGASDVQWNNGVRGAAFSTNNGSSFATAPTNNGTVSYVSTGTSDRTLMGWVKLAGTSSTGASSFFSYGNDFNFRGQHFGVGSMTGPDGANQIYFTDGSTYMWGPLMSLYQWYHIAVVYSAGAVKLFVNGVTYYRVSPCSSCTVSFPMLSTPFGTQFNFGASDDRYLVGELDNVKSANYAMTDAQVLVESRKVFTTDDLIGLVRQWTGDYNNNYDSIIGENMTVVGAAPTFVGGVLGTAQRFSDTSGSSRLLSTSSNLPVGNSNMTISGWVKIDQFKANQKGFFFGFDTPEYLPGGPRVGRNVQNTFFIGSEVNAACGNANCVCGYNFGVTICSPTPMPVGSWVHLALRYSTTASGHVLYVNGAVVASASASTTTIPTTARFAIGSAPTNTTTARFMLGSVDGVRVFKRALGATEVQAQFTSEQ